MEYFVRLLFLVGCLAGLFVFLRYLQGRGMAPNASDSEKINIVARKKLTMQSELIVVSHESNEYILLSANGGMQQLFRDTPDFKRMVS